MISVHREEIDISTHNDSPEHPQTLSVIRVMNHDVVEGEQSLCLNFARIVGFEVGQKQLDRDEPFIAIHFQVDSPAQVLAYLTALQYEMRRGRNKEVPRQESPTEASTTSPGISGYPMAEESQETPFPGDANVP